LPDNKINDDFNPIHEPVEAAGIPAATVEILPATLTPPLNWQSLFGNESPVELEIGSGKGMFLKEAGLQFPDINYVGVELAGKFYRIAVSRLARADLANVRVMHANALDVLDRWIPDNSLQALHIYFPDPWPKKKHHRRRLFIPSLMEQASVKIISGGEFRVATDHPEYGQIMRDQFDKHTHLFRENPWPPSAPDRMPTNYSLKWKRAGRQLWWARFTNLRAEEWH
jgi:tRNA (guanine-N7-)-methyltransferase